MRTFLLYAGAAALAAGMPALAKPDKEGQGGQGGGGKPAHAGKAQKGGGGNDGGHVDRAKPQHADVHADRGNGKSGREVKVHDGSRGRPDKAMRPEREDLARIERARFGDRDDRWDDDRWDDGAMVRRNGYFCPPGLAKKGNGCMPPGQAKKVFGVGERLNAGWYGDYNLPRSYRSLYYDTPNQYYRYDDYGYIYRVDRGSGLVSSLIPLLGGGFAPGQMMPAGYGVYNVPYQYRDTYYDRDDAWYRYGDNAIYQVDPRSNRIESIVALLAGDSFGVGQRLPMGYDVYNVPYAYRDRYYDTDQSMYRYSDGYIYQADPQTQIIQAIISALI